MDTSPEQPRNSISLAQTMDDLIRDQKAMFQAMNQNMEESFKMADKFEKLCKIHCTTLKELQLKNDQIDELQKNNHLLNLHLATVRQAYTREISKYDTLLKDYKILTKKIASIQDLINEEELSGKPNLEHHSSVLSILSSLKKVQTFHDLNDSNPSDDGLLFDKSDDSLDNLLNTTVANVPKKDIDQSCAQIDAETESRPVPIPSTSNVDSPQVKLKKSASTVSNFGANTSMHRLNAMRKRTKFDNERLDVREHTFHQKKAFKPSTVCGACGKTISFCASYLVCTDCHGVTHASDKCKALLPKPCVPFRASKAGLTRMQSSNQVGRMVLLADFTETGSRPCVPALLIHCCNEIDRRVEEAKKNPNSLNSSLSGLYQNATAEKQAKELRLRILSGNGIPNLGSFELNVLCSVVKMFLRDMDDPVVTRIMWNDFVRASEHIQKTSLGDGSPTDSDYESQQDNESDGSSNEEWQEALRVLKAVVVQLPNANRDSLCFLFLHFYRILESSTVVKLSADDLSAVFAPMIVGSSRAKNSTIRLSISGDSRRESEKQITVMKAFFKLSRRFWEGLLKDPDFCPFETTVNFNLNCTQSKLNTSIKKISTSNLKMINDGGVY